MVLIETNASGLVGKWRRRLCNLGCREVFGAESLKFMPCISLRVSGVSSQQLHTCGPTELFESTPNPILYTLACYTLLLIPS